MNTIRYAATLTVAILISTGAEARRYHTQPNIVTCDQRGCSDHFQHDSQSVSHDVKAARAYRYSRKAKITHQRPSVREPALQVDKDQEYVNTSSPNEKLVTRESHERGNGIVRSHKTGATARVSPQYSHLFQAYINDLESAGASIYYMGGYRRGPCSARSMHPCGKALDVCQDARDRVSGHKNCHLPGRQQLAAIAARHGLFEGGQWCHGDMGHAQVGVSAAACGSNLYGAVANYHAKARHHGKRIRYAAQR